jgi:hypothetical protein
MLSDPVTSLAITWARPRIEREAWQRLARATRSLPKPLEVGALHLHPQIYAHDHRLARRSQRPPKGLSLVDEGVHHLLVAVYSLSDLIALRSSLRLLSSSFPDVAVMRSMLPIGICF